MVIIIVIINNINNNNASRSFSNSIKQKNSSKEEMHHFCTMFYVLFIISWYIYVFPSISHQIHHIFFRNSLKIKTWNLLFTEVFSPWTRAFVETPPGVVYNLEPPSSSRSSWQILSGSVTLDRKHLWAAIFTSPQMFCWVWTWDLASSL